MSPLGGLGAVNSNTESVPVLISARDVENDSSLCVYWRHSACLGGPSRVTGRRMRILSKYVSWSDIV